MDALAAEEKSLIKWQPCTMIEGHGYFQRRCFKVEKSQPFTLLITTAAGGVGLDVGYSVLTKLVGSWNIEQAPQLAAAGWGEFRNRWLTEHGVLHRDLAFVFAYAFARTLSSTHLADAYHATFHYQHLQRINPPRATACDKLFKRLEADLADFSAAPQTILAAGVKSPWFDPDALLCCALTEAQAALDARLAEYLRGSDEDLLVFIRKQLRLETLSTHFITELQASTEESDRAWRAFQRLLLAGLQATPAVGQVDGWLKEWAAGLKAGMATPIEFALREALTTQRGRNSPSVYVEGDRVTKLYDWMNQEIAANLEVAIARSKQRQLGRAKALTGPRPASARTFLNRVHELNELWRLLERREARLITLVGPAGIGKTALLAQLLEALGPRLSPLIFTEGEGPPPSEPDELILHGIACFSAQGGSLGLSDFYVGLERTLGGQVEERLARFWQDKQASLEQKVSFLWSCLRQGRYLLLIDDLHEILTDNGAPATSGLRAFLAACLTTDHGVQVIMASRHPLELTATPEQLKQLPLEHGLPMEEALAFLRAWDSDGQAGLRDASPDTLSELIRRVNGVPRTLEYIYRILAGDDALTPAELLADETLWEQEEVMDILLIESYRRLTDPDARRLLEGLAVYGQPAPAVALQYLLDMGRAESGRGQVLDVRATLSRLVQRAYVTFDRATRHYSLHPLDANYLYWGPTPTERTALHARAADYYHQLQLPREQWHSLPDLEPGLREIEHRQKAGQYEAAARLIGTFDLDYLLPWGHAGLIKKMRQPLLLLLDDPALGWDNQHRLGLCYAELGQPAEAAEAYQKSLQIARQMGDPIRIGSSLGSLGKISHEQGHLQAAIEYYQQALTMSEELGRGQDEATWLDHLGLAYAALGERKTAIDYYEQALALHRKISHQPGASRALGNLGDAYHSMGDHAHALEYYWQALATSREIGSRTEESRYLNSLGEIYQELGEARPAIEHYRQALNLSRATGHRRLEERILDSLGLLHTGLGEMKPAVDYYHQALAISREIGNRPGEGRHLGHLGLALVHQGEMREATQHYERALALHRKGKETEDRLWEGTLLNYLGFAQTALGEVGRAVQSYEQALAISRDLGSRWLEEQVLGNLGVVYADLGEMRRAIEHYEQATAISREIGDRLDESIWLGHLGQTYISLAKTQRAVKLLKQAIAISQEVGSRRYEGIWLGHLGRAYTALGEGKWTLEHYERALALSREIRDQWHEGIWLGYLGRVQAYLGDLPQAIKLYKQALLIAQQGGNRRYEAIWRGYLGHAYLLLGKKQWALEQFEQALTLSRTVGDRWYEGVWLGHLGRAYLSNNQDQIEQTIEYYKQALAISREIGDRRHEGIWQGRMGQIYAGLRQIERAVEQYRRALAISREISDRRSEATWLGHLGEAYLNQHNITSARQHIEQALAVSREIGDRREEGECLGRLGIACYRLGELKQALEYHHQALVVQKGINDPLGQAHSCYNLACGYALLNDETQALLYLRQALTFDAAQYYPIVVTDTDFDRIRQASPFRAILLEFSHLGQAIKQYQQALNISRESGDRLGEGHWLSSLGRAYLDSGKVKLALSHYQQALTISREIGDRQMEGTILGSLGDVYAGMSNLPQAQQHYEAALALSREVGDHRHEGVWLGHLGKVYAAMGDTEPAQSYYEQALAISREAHDRRYEGIWLGQLGQLQATLNELEPARAYYEQALAISREVGEEREEGVWLGHLGQIYAAQGEFEAAVEQYEEALAISRETHDRQHEGIWLGHLGQVYAAIGKLKPAQKQYEQALAISREVYDRRYEGIWLGYLGRLQAALGNTRQATEYYKQALAISREAGDRQHTALWLVELEA
jgi:tetratricopeptide (TPR) repeat protein